MNRKSERKYVIQAQARKRSCLTIKGDNHFLKTYRKLMLLEKNRPFLDVLNHQMGVFMINKTKNKKSGFYNTSLKNS
jgi:hypothetical protein